jgi:eukaryotic-like serine/threonine-protein kinase
LLAITVLAHEADMSKQEDPTRNSNPNNSETKPETGAACSAASLGAGVTVDTGTGGVSLATGKPKDPGAIGAYQLVRKLGEGGMGQVWLAEQTVPVKRQVALKLIKGGLYDSAVIQRFESERQSLAVMNHPAIAKVFDAGSTADGQPYFVMEYVDGLPVTRYCDHKKLKIRERLELFIKVCEGVQHAHQKAIIHRDLKPSNVLVGEVDGKPMPRIIDFGIAKAISSQVGSEQTMLTQLGALVGTPGFMSPEQADPSVLDVDTRADVYSLGVILYVLLTGTLPFDAEQWKKKPLDEVLRQLREEDPPSPSTKLGGDMNTATVTAEQRGTLPHHLMSLLKGDLDWITMKALEKDRARRYGTPAELAADIQRYLENRPVVARPTSAGYRLKKYVQRHRTGVTLAAVSALLLVGFSVAQAVQLRRITRERDRADRISQYMAGMFKVSDPNEAKGNSITAREILDKASEEIKTGLSKDPELQAQLMNTMANVYTNLGVFSRAEALAEQAVATGRRAVGSRNQTTLNSMSLLSFLLTREGRYTDAEKLLRETIEGQRGVFGSKHPATLASMRYLASTLEVEGRYAEADRLQRQALDTARSALGPEHWETLLCMNVMANILDDEGRQAEAEKLYRETAEIQRRTLGSEHPDTLTTMSNLGAVLKEEGHLEEAEKIQRETLAIRTRVLGAESPDTLVVKLNLGNTLDSAGRLVEAEKLYRETLEAQRHALSADNPEALSTLSSLAGNLHEQRHNAEAEELGRQALDARRRVLGPNHPDTLKSMDDLARILSSDGKFEEARKLYGELVDIASKAPGQTGLAGAWYDFACGAAIAGKQDQALENLRQAVDHGYKDGEHMSKDEDLKSLRGDLRFEEIVRSATKLGAVPVTK